MSGSVNLTLSLSELEPCACSAVAGVENIMPRSLKSSQVFC